ncbi:MAG: OmpA family protein [bacterium]
MPTRLILTLASLLVAAPALAGPLTLRLPDGASQIGVRTDAPAQFAMPIAGFDGKTVPVRVVTGALDQRAYRLDSSRDNTLALLQPLSDQLAQAGYTLIYQCATTDCGGFDFRFALNVLPEPQMHVDLGDFRYLAAQDGAGDVVSLLISRSADQAFVQVTSVSPSGHVAAPVVTGTTPNAPVADAPAVDTSVAQSPDAQNPDTQTPVTRTPVTQTPVIPDTPDQPTITDTANAAQATPSNLGDALLTTGSVPLDDLVFPSGKAALQDTDYASLADLATWLQANPTLTVTLVGHTDATGSLAGNTALSKQRAGSVRDWLIKHYGAKPSQIDAQGAGYLAPRATNQTPEGRAQNRRVEVMLTSTPPS